MNNIPPHKLSQKEIAFLANTIGNPNEVANKINVPVNFSTFEEQFDKLIQPTKINNETTNN